ncbi:MAG: hypothetical protein ACJAQ6_001970 [Arenicella sp.]|jgi:hypothetical protein
MSEECPFYSNFLLIVYLGLIAPNVSFGTGANATESNATAIGNQESASGFSTTALGNNTDAIGVISFFAGNGSQKKSTIYRAWRCQQTRGYLPMLRLALALSS